MIGINSQIETGGSGDGSVGIGFAVPINTAKSEICELEKGGTVRGAYLGLTTLTVDGSLSALNLPVKEGALVQSVQRAPPAAKAGIHGGTISTTPKTGRSRSAATSSTAIDGKQVASSEDLANVIEAKKPGRHDHARPRRGTGKGKYEQEDRRSDAGHAAELRPEPQHARRLGPAAVAEGYRYRCGHERRARGPLRGGGPYRPRSRSAGSPTCEDAEAAAALGAWALGMIFYPGSPRHARWCRPVRSSRRCAAGSSSAACSSTRRSRRSPRSARSSGLTLVQLHGDEGPSFCSEVARRTGARMIKAARVAGPGDVRDLERFHVDFHLLDARAPDRAQAARRHRRDVRLGARAARRSKVPLILSGGLNAENVAAAIAAPHPYAIDSASGTEAAPGHKDPARCGAVRRRPGPPHRARTGAPVERPGPIGAAVSATEPASSTASAPTAGSTSPRR